MTGAECAQGRLGYLQTQWSSAHQLRQAKCKIGALMQLVQITTRIVASESKGSLVLKLKQLEKYAVLQRSDLSNFLSTLWYIHLLFS